MHHIKTCISLIIILVIFLLTNDSALADNVNLTLSPPVVEIVIQPGKTASQDIVITNSGDNTLLTPEILPYDENGPIFITGFTVDPFLHIADKVIKLNMPFLIKTGEKKSIKLIVNPSSNAQIGEYYRVLLFKTSTLDSQENYSSRLSANIGTILLINISETGNMSKDAIIREFSAPALMDSFDTLKINLKVKNTGTSYFRTLGELKISSPLFKNAFPFEPKVILPDQTRTLETQSTSELENNASPPDTLFLKGLFLGKYTVRADVQIDQTNLTLSEEKEIIALPWKATLIIILAIIVWRVFIRFRRKKPPHGNKP